MGTTTKKEGGTKVGNLLRSIKGVSLPIAEIIDKLVLGGAASEAIALLKGDTIQESGEPFDPTLLAELIRAMGTDIENARIASEKRMASTTTPIAIKYVPSIIDLTVIVVWSIVALYMVYSVIAFAIDGTGSGAAVTAMAIFTAISSKADSVIQFYRGGNSEDQQNFVHTLLGKK